MLRTPHSMKLNDKRIASAIRLLKQAYAHYQKQILALSALGFISGVLEGIGINAVIPLFSLVSRSEGSEPTDAISRMIKQSFDALNLPYTMLGMLLLIASMFIFKGLLTHAVNYIMARITANYERDLRTGLFGATIRSQWTYLMDQKIGYLEKVLMLDIGNASTLLMLISGFILTLTSLCIYTLVALNVAPLLTIATLILGLLMFLVFKPLMYKIRKTSERYADASKRVAHFINQNMIGIKMVKALAEEQAVREEGYTHYRDLRDKRVKISVYRSLSSVFMEPIGIVFICLIFGFTFYTTESFNFASFAVVIYLIHRIVLYTQKVQKLLHDINELLPYLRSVVQFEATAHENAEHAHTGAPFQFTHELKISHVSFRYPKRETKILDRITFSIPKGSMLGLIGPSGSGKTTLVDILLRLLKPTEGKITLDGVDSTYFSLSDWRKHIGYVSQEIFLLNASIAENIMFYQKELIKDDVREAAKKANIADFIENLPEQYDTKVGERGVELSQGQRQRVALARVLARKPDLLILDEATSALDNESEHMIRKAIKKLKGSTTIIAIAHRLSTIEDCDEVIVLDKGILLEHGKPYDLLQNKKSYFHKMYVLNN